MTARMLVGRSPVCGLRLEDPHVSGEHATVLWTGAHWELKDLGSKNGTFIDGGRLAPGVAVRFRAGNHIAFGDPEKPWTVETDAPPRAMGIRDDSGEVREAEADLLVLPSDDRPEISIYPDGTGQWVQETVDGEIEPIRDQTMVITSTAAFRVELPWTSGGTPALDARPAVDTVGLRFTVRDRNAGVTLTLLPGEMAVPFETGTPAQLLLTLARARREDEALPAARRGWRDRERLEHALAIDFNALNVAIHRARLHLSKTGVQNAAQIVEVRHRQRRLGTDRVEIVRRPDGDGR